MYVIVVYDVRADKTSKIHKFLKQRLHWIQNSVFEGKITKSEFVNIRQKLEKKIKKYNKNSEETENSIIIFSLPYKGALDREVIGIEKSPIDNFI